MTTPTTTTTGTRYTRKVSQIERGYLNAAAQGTPALIQTVLEGYGRIDRSDLVEAVRIATDASPGLGAVRRGPMWRGGGPIPPVADLPEWSLEAAPLMRDIDVVHGPVCEVALSTSDEMTRMVVRASHIVTDGRGLQQWMADVFRVLRGEDPVGAASTVDDTHFVAAAGRITVGPPPVRRAGLPPILGTGPATGGPLWVRRTVAEHPPAVTARVAAAIARHLPDETGRVIVPVDLRRHDRSVHSTANLSAQLLIDITWGQHWRAVHSQLLGALMRKREVAQLSRDFLRSNPFANSLREAQERDDSRFACTAIISDHGRFDLDRLRAPAFEPTRIYTLPMLVPYAEMFVSAFQTTAGTELTLACRRRAGARDRAEAVLDDVEQLLAEAE